MDDLALYFFVLYLLLIFPIHIRKHISQLSKEIFAKVSSLEKLENCF